MPKRYKASAERLKKALEHAKLNEFTQIRLSEKLGINNVSISRMLSGSQGITSEASLIVAKKCRVNYDWLMSGAGEMVVPLIEGEWVKTLLPLELDESEREKVVEYANYLVSQRA